MFKRIKEKRLERIQAIREMANELNFMRIRYLHFRSLALECAKDFYAYDNHESQSIAYHYYVRYNKKAEWYSKRLDNIKAPDVFAPFYLK